MRPIRDAAGAEAADEIARPGQRIDHRRQVRRIFETQHSAVSVRDQASDQGLAADAVITTGGVSIGDKDHVKEVIAELGGTLRFWRVNVKPGKPTAFATIDGKPLWGLPGNPVAAMIAFEQFVRPALLKMMGHASVLRPVVKASVSSSFENDGDRPQLVLCRVRIADGKHVASIESGQSSSNLLAIANANGLIELPPAAALAPGVEADVTLLARNFGMRPSWQ